MHIIQSPTESRCILYRVLQRADAYYTESYREQMHIIQSPTESRCILYRVLQTADAY